jgi:AbrB family looped-hinge helix DNA binding protein
MIDVVAPKLEAKLDIDKTLSPEGRVVVPAAVRAALGVGPGDRVRFVVENGEVRLVTAQSLMFAVWANNHGGDAGDSVKDVRQARLTDRSRSAGKQERLEAAMAAEERSEDEIEDGLLAQLGPPR